MTEEYTLYSGRTFAPLRLYAVQGEAGARTFTLTLLDSRGQSLVSASDTAYVYVLKRDGKVAVMDAETTNGSLTFTLSLQACTVPGENRLYIQIVHNGVDLRLDNVILFVEPCTLDDAVLSTDDLGPIASLISDPEYIKNLENALIQSKNDFDAILAALSPKGEYNPEASYVKYNIVAYEGNSYIAIQDVQGVAPPDPAYWALLVSSAVPGPQGPQGEIGRGPARYLVGTTTAGWTATDCDFLCDGVSDQEEISAAIAKVLEEAPNGGEVLLLDGTYNLDGTVEIDPGEKTLVLRGSGAKATTLVSTVPKSTTPEYAPGSQNQQQECANSCVIKVLELSSKFTPKDSPLICDLSFATEMTSCGIDLYSRLSAQVSARVKNCSFLGFTTGLFCDQNAGQADNCYFKCSKVGVQIYGGKKNWSLTDLYFDACEFGVHISGYSDYTSITDCFFYRCDTGVLMSGDNSQITACEFDMSAGQTGVYLDGPNRDSISGNTFSVAALSKTGAGVELLDATLATIAGNTFEGLGEGVSILSGDQGGSLNNTVTGNSFYDSSHGVWVSNDGNGPENNSGQNTITANAFYECENYAVYIGADNNVVSGNTISNATKSIELSANGCICIGNMIKGSGSINDAGSGSQKAYNIEV